MIKIFIHSIKLHQTHCVSGCPAAPDHWHSYVTNKIIKLHYKTKIKHKLVGKKNNNLNKTDQIKNKMRGILIRIRLGKIKIP